MWKAFSRGVGHRREPIDGFYPLDLIIYVISSGAKAKPHSGLVEKSPTDRRSLVKETTWVPLIGGSFDYLLRKFACRRPLKMTRLESFAKIPINVD